MGHGRPCPSRSHWGFVSPFVLALIVLAAPSSSPPAPTSGGVRLELEQVEPARREALARALQEQGVVVVDVDVDSGPITHAIRLEPAADGGGTVVVCRGLETRFAVVAPGPPELVDLELVQRIVGLVLITPPLPLEVAPPPPPPPATTAPPTLALSPSSPWAVSLGGGALLRDAGVDPWLQVGLTRRLWRFNAVDIGVVGLVAGSGTLGDVVVVEPMVGAGLQGLVDLGPVDVSAAVVVGAQAHGWRYTDVDIPIDAGIAGDGVVLVPVTLQVPLAKGFALQFGAAAGATTRARIHTVDDQIAWQRGPLFMSLFGGLSFSPVGPEGAAENDGVLARGDR